MGEFLIVLLLGFSASVIASDSNEVPTADSGVNSAATTEMVELSETDRDAAFESQILKKYSRLKQGVILQVPPKIKTVKAAANYFLTPTGYTLVIPQNKPEETAHILGREPSYFKNSNRFVTVDKALLLIAGNDVDLVVDHDRKYITYQYHQKEQ